VSEQKFFEIIKDNDDNCGCCGVMDYEDVAKLIQAEHEALLREAVAKAYETELDRLRYWIQAYGTDIFTYPPPYEKPDSAAAAMGRHILGILISEFEEKAKAAREWQDVAESSAETAAKC
jgi:hypothetical protein